MILRVGSDGKITELALDSIKFSSISLVDAPADVKDQRGQSKRTEAITGLAFLNGKVIVSGLSNEEFSSNLRSIPFPFQTAGKGASIEIYHGSHGRFETNSPVRTFVAYTINNEPNILAAYTCTPLVRIPVSELTPGNKVKGKTIAELGNRNRPLDMIVYQKDGHNYILMANSSRGVMKLATDNLDGYKAITAQTEVTGVPYETIADLKGVQQLDKYGDTHALILAGDGGKLYLHTINRCRNVRVAARRCCLQARRSADSAPGGGSSGDPHGAGVSFVVTPWTGGDESVFTVYAGDGLDVPAMLGRYTVEAGSLIFHPRYALVPGLAYRAVLRGAAEKVFHAPALAAHPAATKRERCLSFRWNVLPENTLKLYIEFSAPMSRGYVAAYIRLLDASGAVVELPFLEVDQELWDPGFRRMTVLFDPGRIKRGLVPNRDAGPPIEEGKQYTLVIDRGWPDSNGDPLGTEARKSFRRGAWSRKAVRQGIDLKHWRVAASDKLTVEFPEPLDYALLSHAIQVMGPDGKVVAGTQAIDRGETRWTFTPTVKWAAGEYQLQVDTALEDLAGNRIGRAFDVDVFDQGAERITRKTVSIAFRVAGK